MDTFFIICAKYFIAVPFLFAAIWFLLQDRSLQIKIVLFGLACAVVSYGVALIAQQLYFDPRPFVVGHFTPLITHDTENGFPSDHVLLISVLSAVITVFNKKLSVLFWMITLLIAVARVYVGVHHIIDVIGSIFIASAVTTSLYFLLAKRLEVAGKKGQMMKTI